jgi:HD domain
MATIEDAISIAAQAHKGQTDKAGKPYILHPLRLLLQLSDEREMIAAVLHDVVEDSDWTIEGLRREGFSEEVLAAIDCLTRRESESYDEFISRVKTNPLASSVKFCDLMDNLDITRISEPTPADHERMEKYRRALVQLIESNPKVEDCNCQRESPRLTQLKYLGADEIYGEISTAQCLLCGRHWVQYYWVHEAFTGSGRTYLACLNDEQFGRLSRENAKEMIESLDWYYGYGGGEFEKRSGKMNLLFM